MKIIVNGETVTCTENIMLDQWIKESGYDVRKIAVERNKEIVPKAAYKSCKLGPMDKLEVVTFVGGG